MTLADTPTTWPNGPSMSTLHVLLVFAGIPLLVILAVSLLVLAPGWVRGPRYRPGQPWTAGSEWFGPGAASFAPSASAEGPSHVEGRASVAADVPDDGAPAGQDPASRPDQRSGGASAGW